MWSSFPWNVRPTQPHWDVAKTPNSEYLENQAPGHYSRVLFPLLPHKTKLPKIASQILESLLYITPYVTLPESWLDPRVFFSSSGLWVDGYTSSLETQRGRNRKWNGEQGGNSISQHKKLRGSHRILLVRGKEIRMQEWRLETQKYLVKFLQFNHWTSYFLSIIYTWIVCLDMTSF